MRLTITITITMHHVATAKGLWQYAMRFSTFEDLIESRGRSAYQEHRTVNGQISP